MNIHNTLPPGQREISHFPRFGLWKYAYRFRKKFDPLEIMISGDVQHSITINTEDLNSLPRVEQKSDFHCVTTWTKTGLLWSGFRFNDFYDVLVQAKVNPSKEAKLVVIRGQDGFRASLPLDDLRCKDVLLADMLDGIPLSAEHGAPLRLIAPAHYGYKSVKHLQGIEFWEEDSKFRPPAFGFMDHPRARVIFEERGRGISGWLLRILYRPLVQPTIQLFKRGMREGQ